MHKYLQLHSLSCQSRSFKPVNRSCEIHSIEQYNLVASSIIPMLVFSKQIAHGLPLSVHFLKTEMTPYNVQNCTVKQFAIARCSTCSFEHFMTSVLKKCTDNSKPCAICSQVDITHGQLITMVDDIVGILAEPELNEWRIASFEAKISTTRN